MLSLLFSTLAIATSDGGGLPMKTPKAVGMSSERLAKIDHVVERGISAGGYPGASVVVAKVPAWRTFPYGRPCCSGRPIASRTAEASMPGWTGQRERISL